jgi:dienelactone hydrolase
VSEALTDAGVAALLFDLLTPSESVEDRWRGHLSFDIPFLTARLMGVLDWAVRSPVTGNLGIGLFGASTGAAAALRTAAERPLEVQAVVSRGGRPDLAGDRLSRVFAPTLLIVGEKDASVLEMNRLSAPQLAGVNALHIVPGATHLFPESGALEDVGRAAADWFARYLQRNRPPSVSSSR